DLDNIFEIASLSDFRTCIEFINALRTATLDGEHSNLSASTVKRIRDPPRQVFDFDTDPNLRLGLDLFMANINSSNDAYHSTREAIMRRHPEDVIPSYDQLKRKIEEITGVGPMSYPMCKNSCVAFTGPFSILDVCPRCGASKFCPETNKVYQEFVTIPIGPVLQALWRSPASAKQLSYRQSRTREIIAGLHKNLGTLSEYDDFLHGSDYLENVRSGNIKDDDMVLMFSMDGAQLYAHKASDCWIYIWVLFDLSPSERYKKHRVLPGGFIPGPNKPKNMDSFLFPGLYHLAAIQNEGLPIWDASSNRLFCSGLFLALNTADGPGMAYLNGLVGHHGKFGCRLYCSVPGRHKPNGPHYYPALLKPLDYIMPGCDHADISHDFPFQSSPQLYFFNLRHVLDSSNETQYKKRRLETGISKPSIFLGIQPVHILGIPGCFGSDIMHLGSFNISDLLLSLWRGTLDHDKDDPPSEWPWAVLIGDTWITHGQHVAAATPHLPSQFDRPPRNIAEKINSGYKAWEFLLYLYGLAPALLYGILPDPYYIHFCQLVRAMRIIQQHKIKKNDLLVAHTLLVSFAKDFEHLYYQRRIGRIHFVRQSIHALLHLAPEVLRIGPPICSSQWTMERTIGSLGQEIRQPSNPYANLSNRGVLRCQVNALTAMLPGQSTASDRSLPRGAIDLGSGYALLRAQDQLRAMRKCEARVLIAYLMEQPDIDLSVITSQDSASELEWCPNIARWARLRLPNGQIARSKWKESSRSLDKLRISRNVKIQAHVFTLAVISVYSEPDPTLLKESAGTVVACRYRGDSSLVVIDFTSIVSVVGMVPHNFPGLDVEEDWRYVVEKPGLDVLELGGAYSSDNVDSET
ncbi:hypothetical protein HYPSUDRAFT_149723, partial [Hypholoma sublateritium FD-334 SS-4]